MHNMFLKNELQTRMLLDFRVLGRMNIPRGMANDPYRQPKDGGALKIFSKKDFYRREVKNNMINKVITRAKIALRRLKSKKGQTLVEYALILAFIACSRRLTASSSWPNRATSLIRWLADPGSSNLPGRLLVLSF
jgi:hypothetical protein